MDNIQLLDEIKSIQNEAIKEMLNVLNKEQLVSLVSNIVDVFSLQEQTLELFEQLCED